MPGFDAARSFRTGDGSGGWFHWGEDQAAVLRMAMDAIAPLRLSFALQPGSVILEEGNVWEWTGVPGGWVQVPDGSVRIP